MFLFYFGKIELDCESLIFKVDKYPLLYDTSDECYNNRNIRLDAWKKVTENSMWLDLPNTEFSWIYDAYKTLIPTK